MVFLARGGLESVFEDLSWNKKAGVNWRGLQTYWQDWFNQRTSLEYQVKVEYPLLKLGRLSIDCYRSLILPRDEW